MFDLLSCDTMVALGNSTASGRVIFAKNSDRPVMESQALVIIPAQCHEPHAKLKCTYVEIPQVESTYRIMGSKPSWMWGFEHGMNEMGVVIGNEAVFAKEDVELVDEGLLGMDLLRLALERGSTAYKAMHVVTELLERYGQGGSASNRRDFHYHNAFLFADAKEAWILETCNRRWVAKRVSDVSAISNCYSIENEWDEDSGDIKEYALKQGWVSSLENFNFSQAYGAMNSRHRAAYPRYKRANQLLREKAGQLTLHDFRRIQRDHFEGEIMEPRWSPADGLQVTICMHPMEAMASKTAASMQIELDTTKTPIWWNAFGAPCMSIYAPYTIDNHLPEVISKADETYSEDSAWWQFEKLQLLISRHYVSSLPHWKKNAMQLENDIFKETLTLNDLKDEDIVRNTEKILEWVRTSIIEIQKQNLNVDPQIQDMFHYMKELGKITY